MHQEARSRRSSVEAAVDIVPQRCVVGSIVAGSGCTTVHSAEPSDLDHIEQVGQSVQPCLGASSHKILVEASSFLEVAS